MKDNDYEDWFPSPPGRPGQYVVSVSRRCDDEDTVGDDISIWGNACAAKKFIEIVIGDDDHVVEGQTLRTAAGVRVTSTKLKEVMRYEYSIRELGMPMLEPYVTRARNLRFGPPRKYVAEEATAPTQGPRVKREKRVKVEGTKVDRAGLVSLTQLVKELNVESKDARKALREGGIQKPGARWEWPVADKESIVEMLRKAMTP